MLYQRITIPSEGGYELPLECYIADPVRRVDEGICRPAVVICPGTFTRGAKELAESTGVELWDGDKLSRMMRKSGRKPKGERGS